MGYNFKLKLLWYFLCLQKKYQSKFINSGVISYYASLCSMCCKDCNVLMCVNYYKTVCLGVHRIIYVWG